MGPDVGAQAALSAGQDLHRGRGKMTERPCHQPECRRTGDPTAGEGEEDSPARNHKNHKICDM